MFMNQKNSSYKILDIQTGDVNGNNISDTVYLIGEKNQNPFYENINLVIQDGRTKILYTIPLFPQYDMGYDPFIILADFKNNRIKDIFVSLPVGGSGALTYYYVISFENNLIRYILKPDEFIHLSKQLGFEVIYRDYYKVDIVSSRLNKTITLDVSDRKDYYEGMVYDSDGKLIKPLKGFIIDQPHLFPLKLNGNEPYVLNAQQDIAGTSHADGLGYLSSNWIYKGPQSGWVLNPDSVSVIEYFHNTGPTNL
jgi:hypothetical protein